MIERVLIVDDEPLARERIADLARALAPSATLKEAGNGDTAVELIQGWAPDVVLLDIQMPARSGFEVVATIGAERMPPTIFVTAHDEFAIRAFEVAAVDYLLKPFDDERFAAAWQRVTTRHSTGELVAQARVLSSLLSTSGVAATLQAPAAGPTAAWTDRLVVKQDQRTMVVMLADVQYIESDGNYVILHVGRDRYQLRETLSSIESRLDPHRFMRIHRRTIVEIRAMKELQPWFGGDQIMILRDGTKLRVSRNYRAVVARRLAGEV
ncbi:MAG: response regulator transcription factor [Gemmatimonadaceae bacterium]|nr:response regulator transcription factor [Gemmatimonadaceae bacterium]